MNDWRRTGNISWKAQFFLVHFEIFFHQDTFPWKWCYFSRCFSYFSAEPKTQLVGSVQSQTFVGLLLGQLIAPFVLIRFSWKERSQGFCRIGPEECSTAYYEARMRTKPLEQVLCQFGFHGDKISQNFIAKCTNYQQGGRCWCCCCCCCCCCCRVFAACCRALHPIQRSRLLSTSLCTGDSHRLPAKYRHFGMRTFLQISLSLFSESYFWVQPFRQKWYTS